jgi:Protein of unknown function (DUF3047)
MANFATFLLASLALTASASTSLLFAADNSAPSAAKIPLFSTKAVGDAPKEWSFQALRGVKHETKYAYVRDETLNATVLEAVADAAAGALTYRFQGDAQMSSILRFKWRPGNLIASSNPKTKAGDDYVARIYVTFSSDPQSASFREKAENAIASALYGEVPPHAALAYVFTHKAKLGEIITSPYTGRVKKIVVDTDPESVGKWKSFTRDIYDDYKRAFGEEPTRISGIAIMVDTDNTGEKASARFGDITLSARP